jgi:hypothetical protein
VILMKKLTKVFLPLLAVISLIFATPIFALDLVTKATKGTTVYPGNYASLGWSFAVNDATQDIARFVNGPTKKSQPLGSGSVELADVSGSIFYSQIVSNAFDNQGLEAAALSYWAYSANGTFPEMRLAVDTHANGVDILTFKPESQSSAGGQTAIRNTWQEWDGLTGYWRATKANCSFDFGHPLISECKLSEYLSIYPNATIINHVDGSDNANGGVRLAVGETTSDGYVDDATIRFGTLGDEYNFELQFKGKKT